MALTHTPLVLRLLGKKEKTQKDAIPSPSDSDSQMTLISGRSYRHTRNAPHVREQPFNAADMCFGSCCRN